MLLPSLYHAISILLLIGLHLFHHKDQDWIGYESFVQRLRNRSLMGIDINRIISITFFMGSFLAGIGGILWGSRYPQLMPLMGSMPGLKEFYCCCCGRYRKHHRSSHRRIRPRTGRDYARCFSPQLVRIPRCICVCSSDYHSLS